MGSPAAAYANRDIAGVMTTRAIVALAPALVAAALALALVACGGPSEPTWPGAPVVIISIDTLRADRLPAYGYDRVETPAVDALRDDAILFERAYAHTPLTLPSHASLLSGLLPEEHLGRDNTGYDIDANRLPWLPRLFAAAGYDTAAAVSALPLRVESGLGTGFDVYDDALDLESAGGLASAQRAGAQTLTAIIPWMRSVADGSFFLLFHIYEPHAPYSPPEPFTSRFEDPYDGEIAAADRIVGDLLDELRDLGVYDEAIIVLLSDHGEGLGDHGEQEHGVFLYREAIEVPLILKLPGSERAGTSVGVPAQLVDVFPTLVELTALPLDADLAASPARARGPRPRGVSLLRIDLGLEIEPGSPRAIYSETFYPRLHFGWSDLASVIEYPYHYIAAPAPELYDLERDPGETVNLYETEAQTAVRLREIVGNHDRALRSPVLVDAETMRRMEALGYLGSVTDDAGEVRADPKDRIGALEMLKAGARAYAEARFAAAIDMFGGLVESDPDMADAWVYLGRSCRAAGDPGAAVDAFRRAVEIAGPIAEAVLPLAETYLALDRFDDASEQAALADSSHGVLAEELRARIELQRGDLDAAERHARAAVNAGPDRFRPRITLAEILFARELFDEARGSVDAALLFLARNRSSRDPQALRGLHHLHGRLLTVEGNASAAEEAFRTEIRLFPEDPPAYAQLAVLFALTGNTDRTVAILREMVEANPTPGAYAEAVRTFRLLGSPAAAASVLEFGLARHPESSLLLSLQR